jgi:1,4-dihydroxy-2-naphthoyl-CoA synthase
MSIELDLICYEKRDAIAVVTLKRPEKHNALTAEMNAGFCAAPQKADADDAMRVIVVTGAGEAAFYASGDLKRRVPKMDIEPDEDVLTLRNIRLTKPLLAAVNGYCLAGGIEMLLATDLRIAAESASGSATVSQERTSAWRPSIRSGVAGTARFSPTVRHSPKWRCPNYSMVNRVPVIRSYIQTCMA